MKTLLTILLLQSILSPAHPGSSSFFMGEQFVTSFLEVLPVGTYYTQFGLILHGLSCCTSVNITVLGTSFYQNYTLQQGERMNVTLPSSAMLSGSDVSPSGLVLVSANDSICVISEVWATNGYDYSYVYPVELLDLQYYVITPDSVLPGNAQFAILSLSTETSVTVTLHGGPVTFRGLSLSSGSSMTLKLPAFQAAQIQMYGGDLTGSFIQADKPIVVLSGHQLFQRYLKYNFGYMYEQLLPVSSWDKSFMVPPPSVPLRKDDIIYVIASESTNVKVYNKSGVVTSKSLGQGEVFVQPISTSALYIDSDHDVMVVITCSGSSNIVGPSLKPFMSIVMPTSMFQTSQLVHAPSGLTTLVQVLSSSGQTPGVMMDGLSLPSNATWDDTMFKPWKYSWVQVTVSMGSHLIQQLSKNEVWAMSYSFSGNTTSPMAGSTADYLNFYGPSVACSCQVSLSTSSTTTPTVTPTVTSTVTPGVTPTLAPTYSNPTNSSCQGDTGDVYLVMMSLTWWDALRYCRHYYTDLFSFPNSSTQDLVASAIGNINGQTAGLWIGLRRHRIWGHLYWTDREPADYMNWGEDEPDDPLTNMCTVMAPNKNFTWNDQCCDQKLNFICY